VGSIGSLVISWIKVPDLRWLVIMVIVVGVILSIIATVCWRAALATYGKTLAMLNAESELRATR
jgi:hypothetical protein